MVSDENHITTTKAEVISLYDLGNTTKEILENWKKIRKEKRSIILKEYPNIEIEKKQQDILVIALNLMLGLENRQKKIAKEKQARGIELARKRGIKLGRRPLVIPEKFHEVYQRVQRKEMTITKATEILEVDYKTFRKWTRAYQNPL